MIDRITCTPGRRSGRPLGLRSSCPSGAQPETRGGRALLAAAALAILCGGCAARPAPLPPPGIVRYPDFVFPELPPDLAITDQAEDHRRAWLFLQAGDLQTAERTFGVALRENARFYPAEAGLGYVELAAQRFENAIGRFDRALAFGPGYAAALVGRGEALLGLGRDAEALVAFESALAVDGSLAAVRRRVDLLRFRALQEAVDAARQAAADGRTVEARRAYERAINASPQSAFLHRELAAVERKQDNLDAAFTHATRAVELDASDVRSLLMIGEIHESRREFDEAIAAYARAHALEPGPAIAERLGRVREEAELARLPTEYHAIADAETITRGQLAALIGVRLRSLLGGAQASAQTALITDSRNHWASPWIRGIAGVGLMDVYANHTFQPEASVQRGELAQVASRVLTLLAARDAALAETLAAARLTFSDIAPGHLMYPAASRAVAAGILPMLNGRTFQLTRPVTGAEAAAAIERLRSLGDGAGGHQPVARRP